MKKFLIDIGYKYTVNDDLTDKQFTHLSTSTTVDDEMSVMNNHRYIYSMDFLLRLDKLDLTIFANKMNSLTETLKTTDLYANEALFPSSTATQGDKMMFEDLNYTVDTEEKGYLINLTIIVKG